jgi:hypothetical protein
MYGACQSSHNCVAAWFPSVSCQFPWCALALTISLLIPPPQSDDRAVAHTLINKFVCEECAVTDVRDFRMLHFQTYKNRHRNSA